MSSIKPVLTHKVGTLDLRSVGAFRIALGLVVMVNIIRSRWWVAGEYYNPEGSLFPLAWVKEHFGMSSLSLFDVLTSNWLVFLFISIALAVSIIYTLGIATRVTAPLLWFLWWNLNQRNPLLMAGWDAYIEVLLFSSMFLPLNARFSVKPRKDLLPDSYRSAASWLVLTQVSIIYLVNGVTKNGPAWLDGSAVSLIASDAVLGTGRTVSAGMSQALTYSTLAFEIGFPLLVFFPWKNQFFRFVAALIVLLFHWGVSMYADVGYFKWASLAVFVLLLPGWVWNRFVSLREGTIGLTRGWLQWPLWAMAALVVLLGLRTMSDVGFAAEPMKAISLDKALKAITPKKIDNASWLNQDWKLYSPNPPKSDGHIYVTVTDRFAGTISARGSTDAHSFKGDAVMPHFAAGMRFRMGDKQYAPVFTPWLLFELARYEAIQKQKRNNDLYLTHVTLWYHDPAVTQDQKIAEAELGEE